MSGKNNVNPGQYKVAGRERQGEDIVHDQQKQALTKEQARLGRQQKKGSRAGRSLPDTGAGDEKR